MPDRAICEQAVADALVSGYRLIDTAAYYNFDELNKYFTINSKPILEYGSWIYTGVFTKSLSWS